VAAPAGRHRGDGRATRRHRKETPMKLKKLVKKAEKKVAKKLGGKKKK
jgi:hypothetical protein